MNITDYLKPELVVVAIGLYFTGNWMKHNEKIQNRRIPLYNGIISLIFCSLYVFSHAVIVTWQDWLEAFFVILTQSILTAGASTYVNQIMKQRCKQGVDKQT